MAQPHPSNEPENEEIRMERNRATKDHDKQSDPDDERVDPALLKTLLQASGSPLVAPRQVEQAERQHMFDEVCGRARFLLEGLLRWGIVAGETDWKNLDLARTVGEVLNARQYVHYSLSDATDDVLTVFLRDPYGLEYRELIKGLKNQYEAYTGNSLPPDMRIFERSVPLPIDFALHPPEKEPYRGQSGSVFRRLRESLRKFFGH